jgi:hypothetical protein
MKAKLKKVGSIVLFLITGSAAYLDSPREVQARAQSYPSATIEVYSPNYPNRVTYVTLCPAPHSNGTCTWMK